MLPTYFPSVITPWTTTFCMHRNYFLPIFYLPLQANKKLVLSIRFVFTVLTRAFSPTRPFLLESLTIMAERETIATYKPLTLLKKKEKEMNEWMIGLKKLFINFTLLERETGNCPEFCFYLIKRREEHARENDIIIQVCSKYFSCSGNRMATQTKQYLTPIPSASRIIYFLLKKNNHEIMEILLIYFVKRLEMIFFQPYFSGNIHCIMADIYMYPMSPKIINTPFLLLF